MWHFLLAYEQLMNNDFCVCLIYKDQFIIFKKPLFGILKYKFGYTVSKYHRSVLKYSQDLFQEHPRSESSILVRKSQ